VRTLGPTVASGAAWDLLARLGVGGRHPAMLANYFDVSGATALLGR
jgi:hypothetical protein